MGKFKQLDQEIQEKKMTDLKNWQKTDKFEVGLITPGKYKEFPEWLEKNGHTVVKVNDWLSINGRSMKEDTDVVPIFNFLIDEFRNEKK